MNATTEGQPPQSLNYRSAPARGALRREDCPSYYVGRWFRWAALVLCVPLLLWGLTRPIIVAMLDGQTRFALLLLLGLPTLGFCGLFWVVGVILLAVSHRHILRRDVIVALLPLVLGIVTMACVVVLPWLIVLTPQPVKRANAALAQDRPAWTSAAEDLRLASPVPTDQSYIERGSNGLMIAGLAVEWVAVDAAGGVWLRTHTSDAGGIWDYWYTGLVHRPGNVDPFGNRGKMTLTPLGNGWYSFRTRWSD